MKPPGTLMEENRQVTWMRTLTAATAIAVVVAATSWTVAAVPARHRRSSRWW